MPDSANASKRSGNCNGFELISHRQFHEFVTGGIGVAELW
jgi:hypothetical protein